MIRAIHSRLPGSQRHQARTLGYTQHQWHAWCSGKYTANLASVIEVLKRVQREFGLTLRVVLTADGWTVEEM